MPRSGSVRSFLVLNRGCAAVVVLSLSAWTAGCESPPRTNGPESSATAEQSDAVAAASSENAPRDDSPVEKPAPEQKAPTRAAMKAKLLERAATLWAARKSEDWDAVFQFDANRDNPEITAQQFAEWSGENEPFVIVDYVINDAVVDEDLGWVAIESTAKMRQYPNIPARTNSRWEKWRLEEDGWFPVPLNVIDQYPVSPAERNVAAEPAFREALERSWEARVAGDWAAAYDLSDPRDHSEVGYEDFVTEMSVTDYLEYEIAWVEAMGEGGRARIVFRHKWIDPNLTKMPPQTVSHIENWVMVDGEWRRDLIQE